VPGAIGACATPSRVFKGMRMPGQMGSQKVTTLNLEVVEGDAERGLLLIKGSVPGPAGCLVLVRNAVKGGPSTFTPRAEEPTPDAEPAPEEGDVEEAEGAPADADHQEVGSPAAASEAMEEVAS
jgi:hypothetical protein